MTTIDRRHRGRAIRRNRHRHPGTRFAVVNISLDVSEFMHAMEGLSKALAAFSRTYQHPRQIIHNGRKPR